MATKALHLYDTLASLITAGDESAAKKFIIDNFENLPQESKENAIMLFLEEGIDTELAEEEAIYAFQKQALEALAELEKDQKLNMNKAKLDEVRSQLHSLM